MMGCTYCYFLLSIAFFFSNLFPCQWHFSLLLSQPLLSCPLCCRPPRMIAREEVKRSRSNSNRRSGQNNDDDDEGGAGAGSSSKRGAKKSVGGSRGRSAPRDATRSYIDDVTARSLFKGPEEVGLAWLLFAQLNLSRFLMTFQ